MDQQNNRAVPGDAADNGQPQPWASEGQSGPSPVWEGENAGTGWGAPQPYSLQDSSGTRGKRTWTAKKGVIAGGVAVVVAAAVGAGAYAAGSGTGAADGAAAANGQSSRAQGQFDPRSQSGMTGPGGAAGGMDGSPGGLGMGMGGLNAAVHSEYVILQDSNYVTMAGQAGTVTGISVSSLTVKSDDGFTRTYVVGSDVQVLEGSRQRGGSSGSTLSLSDVAVGTSVRVTALKESDSYKAESIQLTTAGTSTVPKSGTTTN